MKEALVVGGANGIGLAVAMELAGRPGMRCVHIVDKAPLAEQYRKDNVKSYEFDLTEEDYGFFDRFDTIDTLFISAGFGQLALFKDIDEALISTYFSVNTIASMRILKHFYAKLEGAEPFYCGAMVSIAGYLSSPFFSVYGATKAAMRFFIESVNVELAKAGVTNRILNVSPGFIKGTSFNRGETDLEQTRSLACQIIEHLIARSDLFIPQYEEVFKNVIARYQEDFRAEGMRSYDYKVSSGRIKN